MNDHACESIEKLLVEYADGELPPQRARPVAEHLAGCNRCRARLGALRESLGLARDIWQAAVASVEQIDVRPPIRSRRLAFRRPAVAAACVVVAAVGVLCVWTARPKDAPHARPAPPLTAAQAERMIDREGAAARLAASAQILADQPGGEQYADIVFSYLIEAYPDTSAGREVSNRISPN